MILDLEEAMIALRPATTCNSHQIKQTNCRTSVSIETSACYKLSDVVGRRNKQESHIKTLYKCCRLKTVLLFTFLIVPDLIRCDLGSAQQNNFHTTAGRHILNEEEEAQRAIELTKTMEVQQSGE